MTTPPRTWLWRSSSRQSPAEYTTVHVEGMHTTPPAGWFTFGSHAGSPTRLVFSAATGDDGLPLWERPIATQDDVSVAHLIEGVTAATDPESAPDDGRHLVTNTITGRLAERIRTRLGVDTDAEVMIREEHLEWGTGWTIELETTFTVTAGGIEVDFFPDASQRDEWIQGAQRSAAARDTMYARFDAWLRAGDDPAGLADAWFEPHELCDRWESWTVKPDATLFRAVKSRSPRRIEELVLYRIPEKVARDHRDRSTLGGDFIAWRLDAIAPANVGGFRALVTRDHFAQGEFDEWAGKISPAALLEITDRFMTGESR